MQRVANVSIFLSFVVYLISALFGYLTFYSKNIAQATQSHNATLDGTFHKNKIKKKIKTKT